MSIVSVIYWWMVCRKKNIFMSCLWEAENCHFRKGGKSNQTLTDLQAHFFSFFFWYEFYGKQNLLSTSIYFFFLLGSPFGNNQCTLWLRSPWHWTHICNTCLHSSGKRITFAVVGLLYVCIYISNQNVKSEVKLQGFCKNLLPILIWTLFFLN